MEVFLKKYGAPKSFILLGCSIINHPFGGTPWYPHKLEPPPSFPLSRSIDATTCFNTAPGSCRQDMAMGQFNLLQKPGSQQRKLMKKQKSAGRFQTKEILMNIIPGDDWSRKKNILWAKHQGWWIDMFFFIRWDVFHVAITPPGMMIDDPQWFENDNRDHMLLLFFQGWNHQVELAVTKYIVLTYRGLKQ